MSTDNGESKHLLDLAQRADRGYQFDAEFHAKVEFVTAAALDVIGIGRGEDRKQEEAARMAAALALVVSDMPVADLFGRTNPQEIS
jgi:hypothetical protein